MADPVEAAAAETLAEGEASALPAGLTRVDLEVDEDGSLAAAESSVSVGAEETLAAEGGGDGDVVLELGGDGDGGSSAAGGEAADGDGGSSAAVGEAADGDGGYPAAGGEGEPEDKLAYADELFQKGSKAIEDSDFDEAVDCLSRALEIRVDHYGELAPECATSYYKYGCALLYKAQEEADPLGNVPKGSSRKSEIRTTVESGENSASSRISVGNDKGDHNLGNNEIEEEGFSKRDQEDDGGSDGDDEDLGEVDEDDSDLDLAWKMLDIARAIVEKCPEDSIEKVNILAALGEVAVEREDIETSLGDYQKALSILENLVEPNHRRIIELNFRICLVLELGSKTEEAISYCKKASALCESRLQKLKESVMGMKNEVTTGDAGSLSTDHSSSISEKEQEIELISEILSELEKKLEDLQQLMLNPKSLFAEMMKMVSSKSSVSEKNTSIGSSQMGFMNGASDSPTVSTAATDNNVTHLGVVGRGVKRASIAPVAVEPSAKKPLLDASEDKPDTSSSGVLDSKPEEP